MGYKVKAKLRIDLGDLGEDQNGTPFFAEMQHPKLLTHGQQIELAKIAPAQKNKIKGLDGQEEEPELTEEEKLKNLEKTVEMTKFVKSFLKAWNLIDIDTEQPIPVEAGNAFERVPGEVVTKIFVEFMKEMKQKSEETKN